MTAAPQPIRHAPEALWRIAEAFLHMLHAVFGAPEDIARKHTMLAKAYKLTLSWIRCAEAIMRRLLLIEAAAYAPTHSDRRAARKTRVRRVMEFTDDKPEEWRVSFRCFTSEDRRLPAGKAVQPAPALQGETSCRLEAGGPRRFYSAWPLAERYEALIRVFNDPAPFARRLAQRLRNAVHLIARVLHAPPEAQHRIDRYDELTAAAKAPWPPPNSS